MKNEAHFVLRVPRELLDKLDHYVVATTPKYAKASRNATIIELIAWALDQKEKAA